ncbi:peptide deformylase [Blattabacterium cuenoti]|uniref:peptide deformylase n=1 Tax=Blattabacterium cuenoti TaxID=1653831 RepID=UPI00163D3314|nr:peptide deformylase [Blattabacterium cuenoti]
MVLPIILYGDPILRKKCIDIDHRMFPKKELKQLIQDMFETVKKVNGIGLSAPQIGKSIRIFIVNTSLLNKNNKTIHYQKVFINAKILRIHGKETLFNEGCLSIPGIMGNIKRKSQVLIEYYNQKWEKRKENISGMRARIILHEYDHLEGKLFIDYFNHKS